MQPAFAAKDGTRQVPDCKLGPPRPVTARRASMSADTVSATHFKSNFTRRRHAGKTYVPPKRRNN